MSIIKRLRQAWSIKKIHTGDNLGEFLYTFSAKNAGQLIIKYAQKRLGKIHYNLAQDDDNYNHELVRCQIAIHAEILADMGHLVARLCQLSNASESDVLKNNLIDAHRIFVTSSPDWYDGESELNHTHLNRGDKVLKELSIDTGEFLFRLLPMTDNLRKSDVTIFQGQIRLVYIEFLEQLGRRIKTKDLQTLVR